MLKSFDLAVNYGQLIVHLPDIERPGHLWEADHLRQGFAWSNGLISLATPEHAEICRVRVDVVADYAVPENCISCVRVPFDVTACPVQVGSVFESEDVDVPLGRYELFFEAVPGEGSWSLDFDGVTESGPYTYLLNVWLVPSAAPSFGIVRAGGGVQSDRVLREDAAQA